MSNATRTDINALRNALPKQFTAGEGIRRLPELTFSEAGGCAMSLLYSARYSLYQSECYRWDIGRRDATCSGRDEAHRAIPARWCV